MGVTKRIGIYIMSAVLIFIASTQAGRLSRKGRMVVHPAKQVSADIARQLPERAPTSGERVILIRKAERVLAVYREGKLWSAYPVALGGRPEGHKQKEGDARTPEGVYYICNKNENSSYHLFLGLSYPNAKDAEAGYKNGLITKAQRDDIISANRKKHRPPWDTPLGGEVGIHGGGSEADWTAGCIALENQAVEELWETVEVRDAVVIEP